MSAPRIDDVQVAAYTIPTEDAQESDGTLVWDSTTIVVVQISAGGHTGLGYTYTDPSCAQVIEGKLAPVVGRSDPLAPQQTWARMQVQSRQLGHDPAEAIEWAHRFHEQGVRWFEEPVSSDDLAGLRHVREHAPPGLQIAAGEYGWNLPYFERMLAAEAVDVLQADVTRCGGITNLIRLDGLCAARCLPLSAHCAPAVSAHACCALETIRHIEYCFDHTRIESMLFTGTLEPVGGELTPDPERPGLGLALKEEAERYRA